VGLVFDVGGRGDKSFNDAAYAGLDSAKRTLGIAFQTLETGEGADREAAMRQLAASGSQLVFGVGFLFSDDIKALANEFPDVKFACVDYTVKEGETLPPNLLALKFKEEEGSYLVGALSALLSRTGTVGFVGGMEIPLIKKFEAGYRAGVAAVKPNARVIVKYAGSTGGAFKDPTKGKELALAEYHQGADIIFHASGSTGLGVFEAARELKKLAIGVDADQYDEAPGVVLTSMVKHVEVAVFNTVQETQAGRFPGGIQVFGLAEDGVGWVYDDRNKALIPDAVKARVDSLRDEIVAGRITAPSH
jgi:basic membrane protein A